MAKTAFEIETLFNLDPMVRWRHLNYGLSRAPYFKDNSEAIIETIRTIHGLADLFVRGKLSEIKIYIGRSSISNLETRLRDHFRNRGLRYALICGVADTDDIGAIETRIIRILKILSIQEALCVGECLNISSNGFGLLPNTDEAIIYIAFDIGASGETYGRATPSLLEEIVDEVNVERLSLSRVSFKRALEYVRRHSSVLSSRWHPEHN